MQKPAVLKYIQTLPALVALFVLALLLLSHSTNAETTNISPWLGNQLKHKVEETITGKAAQEAINSAIDGGHCWKYIFERKHTGSGGLFPITETGCAVSTTYGIAAGQYFHEYGEKYAGLFHPPNITHYPISNSNTLVTLDRSGRSYKMQLYPRFIENVNKGNVNHNENTYTLRFPNTVKDRSGNIVGFTGSVPRASKSGNWVVANLSGGGAVRVDLNAEDGNPLPFGAKEPYFMRAISNDGRFAVTHNHLNGTVTIFDFDTCSPTPLNIRNPVHCNSREIGDYLSEHFGSIERIERIEFLDEHHLRLFVKHVDDSNELKMSEVQLTTSEHELLDLFGGYIAMGDSFASGEGDMDSSWYEIGTDEPENKCHLSRRSYPYLINKQLPEIGEFHSVACSGAVTIDVLNRPQNEDELPSNNSLGDWLPGIRSQISYGFNTPAFITVSIGGNDMGFASKLTECVLGPGTCKYAEDGEFRSDVAKEIAYLHQTLIGTYEQLVARTEGKTRIFALEYPQIVKKTGGSCGLNVHLDDDERKFIYEGVEYINQVIKSAAEDSGIHYLDIEHSLEGANLCSEVEDARMSVNGLTFGDDITMPEWLNAGANPILTAGGLIPVEHLGVANESYHPNQNGHVHMKNSIMAQTANNLALYPVCPDQSSVICPRGDGVVPAPGSYWGDHALEYVQELNGGPTIQPALSKPIIQRVMDDGKKVLIQMTNLKPGSAVNIKLYSNPADLGEYVVNESGILEEVIFIPDTVEPGFHTLRLFGTETAGDEVEYYQSVFIAGSSNDLDANGVTDLEQVCGFVIAAGIDGDQDGIDDACDGSFAEIDEATTIVSEEQTISSNHNSEPNTNIVDLSLPPNNAHNAMRQQVVVATDSDSPRLPANVAGAQHIGDGDKLRDSKEGADTGNGNLPIIAITVAVMSLPGVIILFRRYSTN